MVLVRLQDEFGSGERRELEAVINDCTQRQAASPRQRKFKRVVSQLDDQYRKELQEFLWSIKPHYAITLSLNYPNDATRLGKQKYRNQRPRPDLFKNLDAVLNSRLVKRRANRLMEHMRISIVAFPEFTTTENIHYHLLMWMPDQNRYSNSRLTKEQVDAEIRRTIQEVLEHFFPRASVDVQTIWSKDAVTYATKCVNRSSEIDWNYWRKQSPKHDTVRLNTNSEDPAGTDNDDARNSHPGLGHSLECRSCLPPAIGTREPSAAMGRREAITHDDSTPTRIASQHPTEGDSAWRFDFRGYSYRTLIARTVALVRDWFRMPVTDG